MRMVVQTWCANSCEDIIVNRIGPSRVCAPVEPLKWPLVVFLTPAFFLAPAWAESTISYLVRLLLLLLLLLFDRNKCWSLWLINAIHAGYTAQFSLVRICLLSKPLLTAGFTVQVYTDWCTVALYNNTTREGVDQYFANKWTSQRTRLVDNQKWNEAWARLRVL